MTTEAREKLGISRSLKKQTILLLVLPILIVSGVFTFVFVSNITSRGDDRLKAYRDALLEERKETIRNYTTLAVMAIEKLSQKQALETIRNMRYGKNGYFWIHDFNNFMVAHPDARLQGTDQSGLTDPNGVKILQEITRVVTERGEGYISYVWKAPDTEQLQPKLSYGKAIKKWKWIVGTGIYIHDIEAMAAREKGEIQKEATALIVKALLLVAGIAVLVILLVLYAANLLVNRPLAEMTSVMKSYKNDLTVKIPVTTENEIGMLARTFNSLTTNFQGIIKNFSDSAAGINTYAGDVAVAIEQQAAVAAEQAAAVVEITSTMEELSTSSSQIAEHSKAVVDIATGTWENTKKGANAVESVIMKMNEIHLDNQNSIAEIVALGKKSKEISKVMEIINTIADQTKLIAFNAALEASSAGESGKRFGVVAVEIRRLADSVMESTGEIENKVSEIQEAINRLVIASEKGSKGIQEGMDHSNETASLLVDLVDAAQSTQEAAKQISLSTQQQKTASNQVVTALREIVTGSDQTTDSIKQISAVSKKLTILSDDLKRQVERFTIQ